MKDLVIGIDIGTSGCKSILVDSAGVVAASATEEYPLSVPRPGWAEQDPAHWWAAALKTLAAILRAVPGSAGRIAGIGLSGQMHGLVALDEARAVIRPAFLWNDQRTTAQCRQVFDAVGGEEKLLAYTNNSMLPGYTGGKVLWLREEEPANYARTAIILNPKDYIRFRLDRGAGHGGLRRVGHRVLRCETPPVERGPAGEAGHPPVAFPPLPRVTRDHGPHDQGRQGGNRSSRGHARGGRRRGLRSSRQREPA